MDRRIINFAVPAMILVVLWVAAKHWLVPEPPPEPPRPPAPVAKAEPRQPDPMAADPRAPDAGEGAVAEGVELPPEPEEELITLGSVDPASPYRMLVTFTNRGAAIERLELSSPDYRELHDRPADIHGYLGYLGMTGGGAEHPAIVRVVGGGTPAANAIATPAQPQPGLAIGDRITAARIGEQEAATIRSAADFHQFVRGTHPGDVVTLTVDRQVNGVSTPLSFTIPLMERPLQVIRPETVDFTDAWGASPSKLKPPSYLMNLAQVGGKSYKAEQLPAALRGLREGKWEVTRRPTPQDPTVEFTRRIAGGQVAGVADGELRIVKRYRLAQLPEERRNERFAPSYHVDFELEVHNETGAPQTIAYQLDGPVGTPEEAWWYAYKVHPNDFTGAGTRDVIWNSGSRGFQIMLNAYITPKAKDPADPHTMLLADEPLKYMGVDAIYFSSVLLPEQAGDATFDPKHDYTYTQAWASVVGRINLDKPTRTDVTYHLTSKTRELPPGEALKQKFTIFNGPKDPELLAHYGLDDIVVYGWFAIFARVLLTILHALYWVVGNYGLSIILLTALVRLMVYPISRQVALNAQAMQELQPQLAEINRKYENDLQKRGEATQELYARHGINPLAGCLFMPLQMPIFIGLYRGLAIDVELRQAPLIPGMQWCSNLAGPDQMWYWQPYLEHLWLIGPVFSEHGFLGPWFNLLPIVTMIFFVWQAKQFQAPAASEDQEMAQNVSTYMMVLMGFMFFKVSSGLCLYFIASSVWGIVERWYVTSTAGSQLVAAEQGQVDAEQLAATARDIEAKKARKKRRKQEEV